MSNVRIYTAVSEDLSPLIQGEGFCVDMVRYSDYAALEAKCAALAAENVGLKAVIESVQGVANQSQGIAGWHLNGAVADLDEILPEINNVETPATDASLAEVRAQGVDLVCDYHKSRCEAFHDVDRNGSQWHGAALCDAIDIAAKIRKGVQS